MDQQTLLVIMTVFVTVSAIALLIQAGLLFGIYKASRTLEQNTQRLLPKIEALLETSRVAVDDSRKLIDEVSTKAGEILDLARKQLARIDEVLEDASSRARIQLDRAELILDDTMTRAHETVAMVHAGVVKPLREIQGLAIGLRAAINFFTRGRRDPLRATADEEMFI
jgi:CBS-domain-containing membrane protein